MDWRQFKTSPAVKKVAKVAKPPADTPFATFANLIPPEAVSKNDAEGATPPELHCMVGEALAMVDRLGRPWPARFLVDMPAADRDRLREHERGIDAAILTDDSVALGELLTEWRALLLLALHEKKEDM